MNQKLCVSLPNFSDDFKFNGVPTLAIELRISFLSEVCTILMLSTLKVKYRQLELINQKMF